MFAGGKPNYFDPLGRKGPTWISTLLVAGYCAAMVIEALLRAFGVGDVNFWLLFTPDAAFHHLNLWRLLTYPLVNEPSVWFLLEMAMLFFFGKEVERSVGRSNFLLLYVVLLLAPVIAVTFFQLSGVATAGLAGSWNLNFGIFVSFVMLYPRLDFFFGIAAKWVAIALIAIRSLELLEGRNWVFLIIFWLECLVAALLIRAVYSGSLHSFLIRCSAFQARFRIKKTRKVSPFPVKQKKTEEKEYHAVDQILEKISRRGIGSLTHHERECLEKARSALLKKEKHLQ